VWIFDSTNRSWFWLVAPSDERAQVKPADALIPIVPPADAPVNPPADLSIVFGDGRFQKEGFLQGYISCLCILPRSFSYPLCYDVAPTNLSIDVYGSWFSSGIPPYANDMVTARFVEFRHNSTWGHLPVLSSSSG
jgi:hypothetical protein